MTARVPLPWLLAALLAGALPVPGARAAGAPRATASGAGYAVRLEARAAAEGGSAEVTITSRDGYHVNAEYPMAFKPARDSTVTVSGARVLLRASSRKPCDRGKGDSCEVKASFPFAVHADGASRLAGTLAFSVCSTERCLIEKVQLAAEVERR